MDRNPTASQISGETEELSILRRFVPIPFASIDRELRFGFVNHLFEEAFGFQKADLEGRPVNDFFEEPDFTEFENRIQAALGGAEQEYEHSHRANGEKLTYRIRLVPQTSKHGTIDHVFALVADITEQRRLQREVLVAAEHEKERIGRDLHDTICQDLNGIGLLGKALAKSLERAGRREALDAQALVEEINEVARKSRRMAHGLSPFILDNRTLAEALADLAENVNALFGRPICWLVDDADDPEIDQSVATQLYFAAREAVFNATRHGKPDRIDLLLERRDEWLDLTIADDGGGTVDSLKEGMGIRSMRYRVQSLHGSFSISKNPSADGLRIRCRVPLG